MRRVRHGAQALGLEPGGRERAQQLAQPLRPVHERGRAAPAREIGHGGADVLHGAGALVARVRAHGVGRGIAAARGEVRRVCHDEVKAAGREHRAVLAQVGAEDLRPSGQAVGLEIVPAELRRVRLQLHADGRRLRQRVQQQHRQHTSAAAEVGKAAHAAVSREIGQQHAVRAEGEPGAGARKPRPARPQIVILYAGGHGIRSFRENRLK